MSLPRHDRRDSSGTDRNDLVYVLRQAKPGQTVKAVVLRAGERLEVEVTFAESQRPRG